MSYHGRCRGIRGDPVHAHECLAALSETRVAHTRVDGGGVLQSKKGQIQDLPRTALEFDRRRAKKRDCGCAKPCRAHESHATRPINPMRVRAGQISLATPARVIGLMHSNLEPAQRGRGLCTASLRYRQESSVHHCRTSVSFVLHTRSAPGHSATHTTWTSVRLRALSSCL